MQRSAKLWALPSSISISDISKIYYETNPKSSSLSVYTTRCLHSNQVRCSMVCDILYSRGRQLAARGPHVASHSVFSGPWKHSGKIIKSEISSELFTVNVSVQANWSTISQPEVVKFVYVAQRFHCNNMFNLSCLSYNLKPHNLVIAMNLLRGAACLLRIPQFTTCNLQHLSYQFTYHNKLQNIIGNGCI